MSNHPVLSVFGVGLVACCFGSRPAIAATAAASFGVSAIVQESCRVSFPPDRIATTSAESAVSVTCTHPVSYSVRVTAERSIRPTVVAPAAGGPDRSNASPADAGSFVVTVSY